MPNRAGQILRGIITLPDTDGAVPFVLNLHGFMGTAGGYKYAHVHMARTLAANGIGCARFDFYGCGESDGEFSDLSFDGLYHDSEDLYRWLSAQSYADSGKIFLSGQSMGGYIAASMAPVLNPCGLILMCPGAGMWYGCAQRADAVTQTGKDYADLEGLVYKMAFNYEMAAHPEPYEEAKGYAGPALILRAEDDKLVDTPSCERYRSLYTDAKLIETPAGGHNFASIPARECCEEAILTFIREHL